MVTALIILLYVGNVFLNRHLNKVLCKKDEHMPKIWPLWFMPVSTTIALLLVLLPDIEIKDNWFTGKNW